MRRGDQSLRNGLDTDKGIFKSAFLRPTWTRGQGAASIALVVCSVSLRPGPTVGRQSTTGICKIGKACTIRTPFPKLSTNCSFVNCWVGWPPKVSRGYLRQRVGGVDSRTTADEPLSDHKIQNPAPKRAGNGDDGITRKNEHRKGSQAHGGRSESQRITAHHPRTNA